MKVCTICNQSKSLVEYHKKRKNSLDSRCKICVREGLRKWRESNRVKFNEWNRQWFRSKVKYHCPTCKVNFIRESNEKFCSVKCQLLGRIKIENECWIWQGAKTIKKYGCITLNYKNYGAHRLSYEVFKGKVENNICHSCDNPSCINPEHLWVGTQLENMQDMVK